MQDGHQIEDGVGFHFGCFGCILDHLLVQLILLSQIFQSTSCSLFLQVIAYDIQNTGNFLRQRIGLTRRNIYLLLLGLVQLTRIAAGQQIDKGSFGLFFFVLIVGIIAADAVSHCFHVAETIKGVPLVSFGQSYIVALIFQHNPEPAFFALFFPAGGDRRNCFFLLFILDGVR